MSSITKVKSGYQVRVRRKNYPTQVKNFQYRSDAKSWAEATERAIATGTLSVAEGTWETCWRDIGLRLHQAKDHLI